MFQTGRGVPVIVPPQAKEALAFVCDPKNRQRAGVSSDNPYIFALPGKIAFYFGLAKHKSFFALFNIFCLLLPL